MLIIGVALLIYFGANISSILIRSGQNRNRLTQLEQQVKELAIKKGNLQKTLDYQKTDQFVEQQARNQLGMAKTNETVVIFPRQDSVLGASDKQAGASAKPGYALPANMQAWADFFLK